VVGRIVGGLQRQATGRRTAALLGDGRDSDCSSAAAAAAAAVYASLEFCAAAGAFVPVKSFSRRTSLVNRFLL